MKKVFLGWTKQPFSNYVAALDALGATVERESTEGCDALLLPGGGDIHPRFYGRYAVGAEEIDEARDVYELGLLHSFAAAGKPIFGVCRGLQLINVAFGGTLLRHIDGHGGVGGGDSFHDVRTDDSVLRGLYGGRFTVNSAHHQAIDRLGAGLRVIARADDGTIEAVRHERLPILAVQWHPERLGAEGKRLLAYFLKMK